MHTSIPTQAHRPVLHSHRLNHNPLPSIPTCIEYEGDDEEAAKFLDELRAAAAQHGVEIETSPLDHGELV